MKRCLYKRPGNKCSTPTSTPTSYLISSPISTHTEAPKNIPTLEIHFTPHTTTMDRELITKAPRITKPSTTTKRAIFRWPNCGKPPRLMAIEQSIRSLQDDTSYDADTEIYTEEGEETESESESESEDTDTEAEVEEFEPEPAMRVVDEITNYETEIEWEPAMRVVDEITNYETEIEWEPAMRVVDEITNYETEIEREPAMRVVDEIMTYDTSSEEDVEMEAEDGYQRTKLWCALEAAFFWLDNGMETDM
jgi:hypothetical protein